MIEGLVNQFDVTTLGEELYTMCFTAFMVGGSVCCCVRCLRPETAEEMPRIEMSPKKVPRRPKATARATPLPRRPRRPLASRSEARALPHASRRAATAALQASMHTPCH
jgi:hypothetical protein